MAIKFIKKSKLQVIDGYICDKDGNLVGGMDLQLVAQMANHLETRLQEEAYLCKQPEATPVPSLDGFKRKHLVENDVPVVDVPETPVTDKRIEEALAFAHEMQNVHEAAELNETFERYAELYKFVDAKKVPIDTEPLTEEVARFDTPTLGNPLEWDRDFVTKTIMAVNGYTYKED